MAKSTSMDFFLEVFRDQLAMAIRNGLALELDKITSADLLGMTNRPPAGDDEFPVKQSAKPAISGLLTTHAEGRYNGLRNG